MSEEIEPLTRAFEIDEVSREGGFILLAISPHTAKKLVRRFEMEEDMILHTMSVALSKALVEYYNADRSDVRRRPNQKSSRV